MNSRYSLEIILCTVLPMRFFFIIVTVLLLAATTSQAQTITLNNDLIFGNIFPGIPKTITKYTAGSAAEFHIAGTNGAEISIQFALPTYLHSSGFNIELLFFETDCSIDSLPTPDQVSPLFDNLNPWTTLLYRIGSGGLTIWLGGTAIPRVVQPPGSYSATIVLTVAYTGA